MLDPQTHQEGIKEQKLHDWNIIPKNERAECDELVPSKIGRKRLKHGPNSITWSVSDLAKAGCLLHVPSIGTVFEDEQEMRRVYTLIYDVFRYKSVLMQALNDINFFQIFEQLQSSIPIVWLLFYDLYHRNFKKRETSVRDLTMRLFHHAKLSFPENALWCQRVKLAAAVARLRIKYNALTLSDLLPQHLRNNKVNGESQKLPVTVWVNNRKFKNMADIKKQIEQALKVKLVDDLKNLVPGHFKWDRHCPLTIAFHYSIRSQLAKSNLVRSHKLIVQDRSFCVGPATFWKVVEDLQLSGSVIQTHVNSPRSTAYLANLLAQNEKIKKLMAFSAGRRKDEYESYLQDLGMTNVVIYSDRLVDFGFESPCMEEVVAVYATPPNSYSAVTDPIDLVCSRGGDLSMLEILTESEDTLDGRNRVTKILEEQRKTLKFAMSRPQIQVVLYETHSELDVENSDMVSTTLNEINRLAKLHHASIQGLIGPVGSQGVHMTLEGQKEINNNEEELRERLRKLDDKRLESGDNPNIRGFSVSVDIPDGSLDALKQVVVPDTDLFDTPELPCLCSEETNCKLENGCYLALIQRKQVLRLDNKYMIQMAEQRGLFGSNENPTSKQKGHKQTKRSQQMIKQEMKPKRTKKRLKDLEEMLKKVAVSNLSARLRKFYEKDDQNKVGNLFVGPPAQLNTNQESEDCETKEQESCHDTVKGDTGRKAGGILGTLTKTQLETLISPSFKIWCYPCFSTKSHQSKQVQRRFEEMNSSIGSTNDNKNEQKTLEMIQGTEPEYHNEQSRISTHVDRAIQTIPKRSLKLSKNEENSDTNSTVVFVFKQKKLAKQTFRKSVSSIRSRHMDMTLPFGTFNVKAGPGKLYMYRLKINSKRKKLTNEIINRIALPTEASRIRSMKEDNLPTCRRTDGGTITRDFLCECCKRRHS